MDLVSPIIASHQQPTAFIAWELSKAANLSDHQTETIFVAALLHDVGVISPEEKVKIQRLEEERDETHCVRGELLLKAVSRLQSAARLVRFYHREWQALDEELSDPGMIGAQILFLHLRMNRFSNQERL